MIAGRHGCTAPPGEGAASEGGVHRRASPGAAAQEVWIAAAPGGAAVVTGRWTLVEMTADMWDAALAEELNVSRALVSVAGLGGPRAEDAVWVR
jgi:hypothetical protein